MTPKIKWDLPKGNPPYLPNEAPVGTEHTFLDSEAKRLWHFVSGADQNLSKVKKRNFVYSNFRRFTSNRSRIAYCCKREEVK